MINIRLTVIAGAAAAVLSLIFGIFGEVTAGAVFFRALLSGILFAGFTVGAGILLKQFLPELFDETEGGEGAEEVQNGESPQTGGKVNIVLDSDDEGQEGDYTYAAAQGAGAENGTGSEPGLTGGMPGNSGGPGEDLQEFTGTDDVEELEEAEAVEEISSTGASGGAVPDIGEFENTFNTAPSGLDSLGETGGSGSSGSIEILGGEHSTTDAAKAIQTILKKEQEG